MASSGPTQNPGSNLQHPTTKVSSQTGGRQASTWRTPARTKRVAVRSKAKAIESLFSLCATMARLRSAIRLFSKGMIRRVRVSMMPRYDKLGP